MKLLLFSLSAFFVNISDHLTIIRFSDTLIFRMSSSMMTATIRQRGQLTIPDEVRARYSWLATDSVVSIRISDGEKVIIEPLKNSAGTVTDWKKLRRQLKRVRSYKGERGNLSEFIAQDRQNH